MIIHVIFAQKMSSSLLAVGDSQNYSIRLLDADSLQVRGIFYGHPRGVTCLKFNNDGTRLISGSGDGLMKVWNVLENLEKQEQGVEAEAEEYIHAYGIVSVCFNATSDKIASTTTDLSTRIWDCTTCECLFSMYLAGYMSCCPTTTTFMNEDHLILANCSELVIVQPRTGTMNWSLRREVVIATVSCVAIHPQNPDVLVATRDDDWGIKRKLIVISLRPNDIVISDMTPPRFNTDVAALYYNRDSSSIAVVYEHHIDIIEVSSSSRNTIAVIKIPYGCYHSSLELHGSRLALCTISKSHRSSGHLLHVPSIYVFDTTSATTASACITHCNCCCSSSSTVVLL
jgi:WD40 repeat protein